MLEATGAGRGSSADRLHAPVVIVRNNHGTAICICVETGANTQQVYSVDRPAEFNKALATYGVAAVDINDIKV
jgi:hypothetical protein